MGSRWSDLPYVLDDGSPRSPEVYARVAERQDALMLMGLVASRLPKGSTVRVRDAREHRAPGGGVIDTYTTSTEGRPWT